MVQMYKLFSAVLLSLTAFAFTASADLFDFSYDVFSASTGTHDTASGTLTATFNSVNNDYQVTAITGTSTAWGSITGLLPAGSLGDNDNLLFFPAQPYINGNGISFTVQGAGDDGNHDVNVFSSFGVEYFEYLGAENAPGTFSVTPVASSTVPEPSVAALLLFVIAATGRGLWRSRRRDEAAKGRSA
jgi:hypothetical protein